MQIHAFGINRMDSMQRMGQYPLPPGVSTILGVEFSGTIEDPNGSSYAAGDEVFGLAYGGAYAQYIACSDKMVVRKPAEVSHVKAAAIPENWITAWQALYTIAGLQPGKSVMIHAGASGVGLAAIQLAKTFTKYVRSVSSSLLLIFCAGDSSSRPLEQTTRSSSSSSMARRTASTTRRRTLPPRSTGSRTARAFRS